MPFQDAGFLLSKPWPYESDTKGKAVSLLAMMSMFAQFITALFMGALIQYFDTPNMVFVVCLIGTSLATLSSWFVVTKPMNSKIKQSA